MPQKADPLSLYNAKRDFARTAEPPGKAAQGSSGNLFIVQKHDATRLHWDLRLEVDGVLKSWAVTKGPSPDPSVKRLAVRTEDHPMSYAEFEGVIPAGEYGGGTVMLWDRGTWSPVEGKSSKDLDKGHLHFSLDGERMKGDWLLIRLKQKPGEKRENWLLRKLEDAQAAEGDILVERELTSIATGRSMAEIAAGKPAATTKPPVRRAKAGKAGQLPAFRGPQLATLVDSVPAGNGWMHEIKFDGYRALVAVNGARVKIFTRSGQDWTEKFAPLVKQIATLDLPPALIDGEIVASDAAGNPDFSTLQSVLKRGHGSQSEADKLGFHAFDVLEISGEDLTRLPNIERKERLEALLSAAVPPVGVADHVIGAGEALLRSMCDAGQEGIISKRIDGTYRSKRSRDWVKVKCTRRQEFIIVGWKPSRAKGRPFASLLLAQHERGELVYKGNVGTGFGAADLEELSGALKRLERKTPPVPVDKVAARGVHWVSPQLVAEIAFAEFTATGSVRHGSYLGLRSDKKAKDVKPEKPVSVSSAEPELVAISNRERVIFPDSGQTKGDLADYYLAIAPIMLPFAASRPLSLVRCPQGRAWKCFFQKHDSGGLGPSVHSVPILEKDGETADYICISDAAGLLQCVQMGTIEFHGWCARSDAVERPERLIFDLDPDTGLDFADVKQAARDIHDRLADIGLTSFAMLSGGKGVHIIAPLSPGHTWDAHKDFARRFAEALSLAEPDQFTATMSKAKRKGRIFIDWLRNQRGSTAVLPYSARARIGAPVAAPVTWNELAGIERANAFSIADRAALLARAQAKSLAGWGFAEQALPDL
ncbi:DNA ligase D [Altererythrobacter sp. H2]|uniref:DNA ligase D n=1 Tax=Altererythrobacter sp. H2 TaxID=3108391 RepID=UPI002B4BAC4A|nr:DNA ligase D [Altererythrobacter sp. H2]WRK95635.1 DNA ligase D [Altererythrobacter sp. H2]